MQQTIAYWRDIPAQVIVKQGRQRGKALLPPRFQQAIDRAAMRAGKGGSDEYLADWRRETTRIADAATPQAQAAQTAATLEAEYPEARLAALVKNKGKAPSLHNSPQRPRLVRQQGVRQMQSIWRVGGQRGGT